MSSTKHGFPAIEPEGARRRSPVKYFRYAWYASCVWDRGIRGYNMKKLGEGFTLIELMIVVAIIGIIASVAMPAYQDYLARAQASEAVSLLSGAKIPISEFIYDKGAVPDATEFADLVPTRSGKYVDTIVLTGTVSNLLLTATMKM